MKGALSISGDSVLQSRDRVWLSGTEAGHRGVLARSRLSQEVAASACLEQIASLQALAKFGCGKDEDAGRTKGTREHTLHIIMII